MKLFLRFRKGNIIIFREDNCCAGYNWFLSFGFRGFEFLHPKTPGTIIPRLR